MSNSDDFDLDDLLMGVDNVEDEEGEESSKVSTTNDSVSDTPGDTLSSNQSSNDSKPKLPPVEDPPLVSHFGTSDDNDDENDLDRKSFSPKKLSALRALANMGPGDTMEVIAEKAGVSKRSLYRYLASNRFRHALREIRDRELASIRIAAGRVLARHVLSGDMEAMRIYLKMVGDAGVELSSVKVSNDSADKIIADALGLELDELPED